MSFVRPIRFVGKSVNNQRLINNSFGSISCPRITTASRNLYGQNMKAIGVKNMRMLSTDAEKGDKKEGEASVEEDQIKAEPTPPSNEDVVAALKKEIREMKDKVIRSYAEEENVRRIAKRDVENARAYANTSFAKSLLDVADDLERALSSVPQDKLAENAALKSLYDGISMTDKQLHKVFNQFKVFKYGTVGDKFDPDLHDALFQGPDPTKENGTISQVLKNGYKLNDRVIRAAQVGTVNNPPAAS